MKVLQVLLKFKVNQKLTAMKKINYLLICFCLFLISCGDDKVPYQTVPNAAAVQMIKYYLDSTSTADHSFLEIPKVTGFDPKTLKAIAKGGNVEQVKFFLAAYLLGVPTIPGQRNTVLLQVMMMKDGNKTYSYYDIRKQIDPKTNEVIDAKDSVCPLPNDCAGEIEDAPLQ